MPNNESKTVNKKRRRPPVPAPPEALVRLLRSDPAVVQYFQALQANLNVDVEVWKDRAHEWKEKYEKAVERYRPVRSKRGRQKSRDPSPNTTASKQPLRMPTSRTNTDELPEEGLPIDDSMFEMESSDDEKDDEAVGRTEAVTAASTTHDTSLSHNKEILELLREAYEALERLGVPLVKEDRSDSTETTPTFTRRPNEHVAGDLLSSMRELTRVQLLEKDWLTDYAPFDSTSRLPVLDIDWTPPDRPVHPAGQGRDLLLRALVILDTFCPTMTDTMWDAIWNSSTDEEPSPALERMRVGLRDRRQLVQDLIDSLHGEIAEGWALHDRTERHTNCSLHIKEKTSPQAVEKAGGNATSQSRLSLLLERYWISQLLVGLYLTREDPQSAAGLLIQYLGSNVPSLSEDYPTLPPTFSFVVLRGLLQPNLGSIGMNTDINQPTNSWFSRYLRAAFGPDHPALSHFFKLTSVCFGWTARIFKNRLLRSDDDRIRYVSEVELASFEDLPNLDLDWIEQVRWCDDERGDSEVAEEIEQICSDLWNAGMVDGLCDAAAWLAMIVRGGIEKPNFASEGWCRAHLSIFACRQSVVRNLGFYLDRLGSRLNDELVFSEVNMLLEHSATTVQASGEESNAAYLKILRCACIAGLGKFVFEKVHSRYFRQIASGSRSTPVRNQFEIVEQVVNTPVVRVINLACRQDRLNSFHSQCARENLLLVLSVADIRDGTTGETRLCGRHAIDGKGRMASAHAKLVDQVGNSQFIQPFVQSSWRPLDLKAFDKDAPTEETLVKMSTTEIACALSHIASWKGVSRSLFEAGLDEEPGGVHGENSVPLFRSPSRFVLLSRISGFAEGAPLDAKNESMPPSPVCIILEDDAILVELFRDRLASLLKELPRDFHFCALGYGRPKTAPILPFGKHIGIPSHLFYLTGYIISASGAEFLLQSLPVVGPVDSWIGLKMTSNWDNAYGVALGVGAHSKGFGESPPRKELATILRFRSYCALNPLCSQKVGTSSQPSELSSRVWRQRDTDVEYSGDQRRKG